jgi:DNA-binding response OmpR family regulator
MGPGEAEVSHRILLVDGHRAIRKRMTEGLERKGFEVVAAANVTEALACIASESFDVLITDMHIPDSGDGFTVVSAMRHSQPNALTMMLSGYPDAQSAMAAIVLEADEIVVKPFELEGFASLVRERLLDHKPARRLEKERVGAILRRCTADVVANWLARAQQSEILNRIELDDRERAGYLPRLVEDLALRLGRSNASAKDSDAAWSAAAVEHGRLRCKQGYSPDMMVHESRLLQVTLFGTLQGNLDALDFGLLLPDVMAIADEVDAQLTQSMNGYMDCMNSSAA